LQEPSHPVQAGRTKYGWDQGTRLLGCGPGFGTHLPNRGRQNHAISVPFIGCSLARVRVPPKARKPGEVSKGGVQYSTVLKRQCGKVAVADQSTLAAQIGASAPALCPAAVSTECLKITFVDCRCNPRNSILSAIDRTQSVFLGVRGRKHLSRPKRVIRIGFFVLHTRFKSARHFALNSEMAISCIPVFLMTASILLGHYGWSKSPVSSSLPLSVASQPTCRSRG